MKALSKKTLSKKTQYMIYTATFLIFVVQGFYVGIHHEPWADEGQAWLIARDNPTFVEMLKAVRYEGTPPLWHIIVKISQLCGLSFEYFFVLPLLFSAIGVLLLFRTKAPLYCKILLPFTYYIAYQNTVVARSYSLVFPIMMTLLLVFEKRREKPAPFFAVLVLLSLTSSYGIIVTGSFLLYEFVELMAMIRKNQLKECGKRILCFGVTAVLVWGVGMMILPPSDCIALTVGKNRYITEVFDITTKTLIVPVSNMVLYCFMATFCFAFILFYCKKNWVQVLIYTIPLLSYYVLVGDCEWHLTYLYILVVFMMIVFRKEGEDKIYKAKEILVAALLILQCSCGLVSAVSDIKEPYSGSKEASEFLRQYVEKGAKISAVDYYDTALSPYFESNIFVNRPQEEGYYIWSENNKNMDIYHYEFDELNDLKNSDVLVSRAWENAGEIELFKGYKKYEFEGKMFYKFTSHEMTKLVIWVK